MRFECDGKVYNSDEMLQPRIEDKYIIALYVTADYSRVFGTFMHPDSGVVVKRIQEDRLAALANRTQSLELLKAVELENTHAKA